MAFKRETMTIYAPHTLLTTIGLLDEDMIYDLEQCISLRVDIP